MKIRSHLAAFCCLAAAFAADAGEAVRPAVRWRGFNLDGKAIKGKFSGTWDVRDLALMREWGFNFARVMIDYRYFCRPGTFEPDAALFPPIDEMIGWGRKHDIHIQVCFSIPPGVDYAVSRSKKAILEDPALVRANVACWAFFAHRYRDVPAEALSFNLFNEPPNVADAAYGRIAKILIEAIRREDPARFIVADGLSWGRRPVKALAGIPVCGAAGDQQSALFGQGCHERGQAKNTYGTGCFLLMNTGNKIYQSKNGLVTTIAISLDGKVEYALEGSVFVGGAVIQWIRDGMHLIQDSCDSEYYAQKVPDNGGVYIVPAFTGLGAPYWDMYARGAILGITRGTTQNHIIRAAEESIAYQSADLMWAMEKDTDITISTLKVDGGASRDHFLMQFQSDILNKEVLRPAIRETTALGAAYLAGLATGVWKSREEISHLWSCNQLFEPKMDAAQREKLVKGWHKAVGRSQDWAEHEA